MNSPFGFFIFNAAAGSAKKFSPEQILAELPSGTQMHIFSDGDDPVKLAKDAIAKGAAWIAVAGGDGTVEAVASALANTNIPLGVIACGTFNNFGRSAGIPEDPLEAARLIGSGETRLMDVGFVNDQPFFECVGVGLDAAIFPLGEEIKSGGLLKWLELFRVAAKYPRRHFDLTLDRPFREALVRTESPPRPSRSWLKWFKKNPGKTLRLKALMITVSNGPFYGAHFAVAPNAKIDDGLLTITIFKQYNKLELWWHFFSISFGRRKYAPRVVTLKVCETVIGGPEKLEVHKDGSNFDGWPLTMRLASKSLRVFTGPVQKAD